MRTFFFVAVLLVLGPASASARGQCRPVSGCDVPSLAIFDSVMIDFMCENDIGGGTLAMTRNGVLVYARAYGWSDQARTIPLKPDALMRIASVSKPITDAAVRQLISEGRFTLDTKVFDLGQPGGGLLDIEPFPSLGDPRLADITVQHLLNHTGGWDRELVGDLTYREVVIADAMGIPSPPGRLNTVRYILGQPLQHTPGTPSEYSNIGALVFGLIIEQERGHPLEIVLDGIMATAGVAINDHKAGRTFKIDQDPREPFYQNVNFGINVFNPSGPLVNLPYGTWDHEARIGQGGQIATAAALARFAAFYYVNGPNIGVRRPPNDGGTWLWNHTGAFAGTTSLIRQRGTGTTYAVIFNRRSTTEDYSAQIRTLIDNVLTTTVIDWPSTPTGDCCPGDINGDGITNASDFNILASHFRQSVPPGTLGDLTGDGIVNASDFNVLAGDFRCGIQ